MSSDPMCVRCLHVHSEHKSAGCLPTLPGGSPCTCERFINYEQFTAEQLRVTAADLLFRAWLIERGLQR